MDHLCYLCLVFVMLLHLFNAALWSPAVKGLNSWILFVMIIVFLSLSHVVCLIASIPDLCHLYYFDHCLYHIFKLKKKSCDVVCQKLVYLKPLKTQLVYVFFFL